MARHSYATTPALIALRDELTTLERRLSAVQAAIAALTETTPTLPAPPRKLGRPRTITRSASARKRIRKARHGERQAIILEAYQQLTSPTDVKAFARGLGGSAKQRRLWTASILRQGFLDRMDIRDGVIYPVAGAQ